MPEPKDIDAILREFARYKSEGRAQELLAGTWFLSSLASLLLHTKGRLPKTGDPQHNHEYDEGIDDCHSVIDAEIAKIL